MPRRPSYVLTVGALRREGRVFVYRINVGGRPFVGWGETAIEAGRAAYASAEAAGGLRGAVADA